MKTILALASVTVLVAACTTPMTTLKHPKTGQVAKCGGESTGSFVGGAIGYHMQKDQAAECVRSYETQGFKVIETKEY